MGYIYKITNKVDTKNCWWFYLEERIKVFKYFY